MKYITLFLTSIIAFASFVNAQPAKKSTKKSTKKTAAATKVVDSGQTLANGVGYLNKPESFFEAIPGASDNWSIGYRFPVDGNKIKAEVFTSFKDKRADTVIFVRNKANFSEDELQTILKDNLPAADLAQLRETRVAPVMTNALSYNDLQAHTIRDPETKENYYIERGSQAYEEADSYVYITTSSNRNDILHRSLKRMREEVEKARYNLRVLAAALK
jgi:hypothetical protein